MKKYLIFTMILLTVLACKSKQKPGNNIAGGAGGSIVPPTIASEDEVSIKNILERIPNNFDTADSGKGWQNSDWKNVPLVTAGDLHSITNKGFFVTRYSTESWIVFSINHERDVYVGLGKGFGQSGLEAALNMLQKDGDLVKESWDPRKLVYNYGGDSGEISIAWLGRARYDHTGPPDKRYKGYDDIFPNALTDLTGDNKTYATLRNYSSIPPSTYIKDTLLYGRESRVDGFVWGSNPIEDPDGDQLRKIWASDMYNGDPNKAPKYHGGKTSVTTRVAMRFGYAPAEGGYLSSIGTKGNKATPTNATLADKEINGQYLDEYDTTEPRGKTAFYRTPEKIVQFLTTVVAYNIRMRDSTDSDANSLFEGKYDVKELIFEFDSSSFEDTLNDGFSPSDLPKRQLVPATDEIAPGSSIKTDKIPVLYFSPK